MRKSPLDTRPARRSLRIFAFDPMIARGGEDRVTLSIPYRDISREERQFWDDRLEVVDYDAATDDYYLAIDLDDAKIAMQDGVEPSEAEPQFHQQMVYAVASSVLERFDRALGHTLRFAGGRRLRLLPHAFQGKNAYYDQELNAVLFGYFRADRADPGPNLPGQLVFTCLSHDIVAHEVTHAALDRLHRHYREPTNLDVPAFHEGFADVVALFHRFTFPEVVADAIRKTRNDLLAPESPMLSLGAQFGHAAGLGDSLRRATRDHDPRRFEKTTEPHARGAMLLSAVYEAFVRTYERRTADLLRLATGGSGRLPDGELHPDLVARLAAECAETAELVLAMVIRATDYMPPVDPRFSDFLRAMVTADYEHRGADRYGLRAAMIEAFRVRGIQPEAVGSLAVESLLLEREDGKVDEELASIVARLLAIEARAAHERASRGRSDPNRPKAQPVESPSDWVAQQRARLEVPEAKTAPRPTTEPDKDRRELAISLWGWGNERKKRLGLDPDRGLALRGFHLVPRIAPSGEPRVEMVAQLVQSRKLNEDLGGLTYLAGVTLVASGEGSLVYAVRKPFHRNREHALRAWVAEFDDRRGSGWGGPRRANRITEAYSVRALESRRWR